MIKLVTDKSDAAISRAQAEAKIKAAARELAANVLRTVAGAGRPGFLAIDASALLAATNNYEEVIRVDKKGHSGIAADLIRSALNPEETFIENRPGAKEIEENLERAFKAAIKKFTCGALRFAAATLLDQMTQQTLANHEIHEGLRMIEKLRKERRQKNGMT